jgi:WD40 repeat protein
VVNGLQDLNYNQAGVYDMIKALPLICIFFLALISHRGIAQDQTEYSVINIDNFASLEVIDTKQLNDSSDRIYILPDGKILAITLFEKQISIRDLDLNSAYSLSIPFNYDFIKVNFPFVFIIGIQGKLMAYDIEQHKTLYVINPGEEFYNVALSPDQKILATGHFNHIKLWHFPFLFPYWDEAYYELGPYDEMVFVDNDHLIISSFGISSLNIKTGERIVLGDGEEIRAMALSRSGGLVAFSEQSVGSYQVWSWQNGRQIFSTIAPLTFDDELAFTFDSHTLVSISHDGLMAWDISSQRLVVNDLLRASRQLPEKVTDLFFSPDGQFLIVRYDDLVYTLAVRG